MRKIGILTLTGKEYNHHMGAVLQAYALQKTLDKLGFSSEIIDFIPTLYRENKFFIDQFKRSVVTRGLTNTIIVSIGTIMRLRQRKRCYYDFKSNYMTFTSDSFNSLEDLKEITDVYDAFIVGSDTVWMPQLGVKNLEAYLLKFAEDTNTKISYAASIWYPIPLSLCPLYKTLIERLDFVSVREKTSLMYLKQCGVKKDIKVVLDPTLLLSQKEYRNIAKVPNIIPDKPYIFYYDVHLSKGLFQKVISFAKKTGHSVVTETAIPRGVMKEVYSFYGYGPPEFLGLIQNSDLVITTSFHGTVFSVIFKKQFYSIKSDFAPSTKIIDFLESIGLQDRFISLDELKKRIIHDKPIEWDSIEKNLKENIDLSLSFLKMALKGVRK
ncbi:polysaccharide pyruvyl transferase family protein [Pyrococcus kukulkanii]|uniref:polysaccharide pyruvyl transferase family protein n=1 Tax=Pyrococcus kukulkanii TaxID=1609559 RepID=UPI0035642953